MSTADNLELEGSRGLANFVIKWPVNFAMHKRSSYIIHHLIVG